MRPLGFSAGAFAGAFMALFAFSAMAQGQDGTPTNVRGRFEKLDGQYLTVRSRDGKEVPITMTKDFAVRGVAAVSLSDIRPGDFVGVAAVKGTDGKLHAQEVLIFPEAMRGTGEGHYPWDLTPESTMTNATVAEVAGVSSGRLLHLKHKGGENDIEVAPDTPVVRFVPADATLLRPGATVFVRGLRRPDGSITAGGITVEKDGVKPPM